MPSLETKFITVKATGGGCPLEPRHYTIHGDGPFTICGHDGNDWLAKIPTPTSNGRFATLSGPGQPHQPTPQTPPSKTHQCQPTDTDSSNRFSKTSNTATARIINGQITGYQCLCRYSRHCSNEATVAKQRFQQQD